VWSGVTIFPLPLLQLDWVECAVNELGSIILTSNKMLTVDLGIDLRRFIIATAILDRSALTRHHHIRGESYPVLKGIAARPAWCRSLTGRSGLLRPAARFLGLGLVPPKRAKDGAGAPLRRGSHQGGRVDEG